MGGDPNKASPGFKHLFGDDMRKELPSTGDDDKIHQATELIQDNHEKDHVHIDWESGRILKWIVRRDTNEGTWKDAGSISKALSKAGAPQELIDWSSHLNNLPGDKRKSILDSKDNTILISRHPIDVVRMSDFSTVKSCHSPDGSYFRCAIDDAKGGGNDCLSS